VFTDDDARVRIESLQSICNISGEEDQGVLDLLVKAMKDEYQEMREVSAGIMRKRVKPGHRSIALTLLDRLSAESVGKIRHKIMEILSDLLDENDFIFLEKHEVYSRILAISRQVDQTVSVRKIAIEVHHRLEAFRQPPSERLDSAAMEQGRRGSFPHAGEPTDLDHSLRTLDDSLESDVASPNKLPSEDGLSGNLGSPQDRSRESFDEHQYVSEYE